MSVKVKSHTKKNGVRVDVIDDPFEVHLGNSTRIEAHIDSGSDVIAVTSAQALAHQLYEIACALRVIQNELEYANYSRDRERKAKRKKGKK